MSSQFGPWIGVPKERQDLCAIDGCKVKGLSHRCPADSSHHHHGCVHYELASEALYTEHMLKLREGWGLLCTKHYLLVREIIWRAQERKTMDPTADAPRTHKAMKKDSERLLREAYEVLKVLEVQVDFKPHETALMEKLDGFFAKE